MFREVWASLLLFQSLVLLLEVVSSGSSFFHFLFSSLFSFLLHSPILNFCQKGIGWWRATRPLSQQAMIHVTFFFYPLSRNDHVDRCFYPSRSPQNAWTQTRAPGEDHACSHHSRYPTPRLCPWQLPLGLSPLHAVGGPNLCLLSRIYHSPLSQIFKLYHWQGPPVPPLIL